MYKCASLRPFRPGWTCRRRRQEIIGSISQREFTKGIIITTSGCTSVACQEAERLGVELYDGERLLWLLRHHLHREFNIIDQSRRKPSFGKPPGLGNAANGPIFRAVATISVVVVGILSAVVLVQTVAGWL